MKFYRKHESMKGSVCWYCSRPATTEDHWPPKSIKWLFPDLPWLLVRSCRRCNSWLSDSMQGSIEARKLSVHLAMCQDLIIVRDLLEGTQKADPNEKSYTGMYQLYIEARAWRNWNWHLWLEKAYVPWSEINDRTDNRT